MQRDGEGAFWSLLAVVLALCGLAYFAGVLEHPPMESLEDFSAFYCADRLIVAHESPYDENVLGQCERAVAPWRTGGTLAAPYPPYALMLLSPLSLLPFGVAGTLWIAGLAIAVALSCVIVARLARAPLVVAVAAFAAAVWFPSMISTSMAPYPVLLLLVAAYALRHERWTLAAIFLALGMIKPNLGLPVCVAAFAFVPQLRWRLAAAGAALFAAQSLFAGWRLFFAYLSYVRVYAGAELVNAWQYSLAYLLHMLGAPGAVAIDAAWAQYALACAAGAIVGMLLARRFRDGAWIVLAPLAFCVVGGIYSRQQELAAAIPFGVALAYRAPRSLARYGLLLLATPWSGVYGDAAYPPFVMLSTGTLVHQLWKPPRIVTLLAAFAGVALLLAFPNGTTASNASWFLRHLPEWAGLLLLVVASAAVLTEGRRSQAPQPPR